MQARRLELLVNEGELTRRCADWQAPPPASPSGYVRLFHDHVMQADKGCDFAFLLGERTSLVHRGAY